jgi:formamidopyrimidine-DNA glycosylase
VKGNIIPELPEVETAKRQLSVLEGFKVKEVVVRKKNNAVIKLKKPVPAKELQFLVGKTLLGVKRRAKYLFLLFDDYCLVCHFGMTGMLHFNNSTNHEVVRLTDSKGNYISYCDTRKFGLIDVVKRSKLKSYIEGLNIGYEPLGTRITADILAEMLKKSNTSKILLSEVPGLIISKILPLRCRDIR